MGWVKTITGFMASSNGSAEDITAISECAKGLGARGKSVIYGGGDMGLMGVFARSAREGGCLEVIGYIPRELLDYKKSISPDYTPIAHIEHVVENMSLRKIQMIECADVGITFKGGSGSMDEFWEFLTAQEIKSYGSKDAPISDMILVNRDGYYDGISMLKDSFIQNGMKHKEAFNCLHIVSSETEALDKLDEIDRRGRLRGGDLLPGAAPR